MIPIPNYIVSEDVLAFVRRAVSDGVPDIVLATIIATGVRPDNGKWILKPKGLFCSVCGKKAAVARDAEDFWFTKGTDYCPNCGAKMDGG